MLKNTEKDYYDLGTFYKIYKTSNESQIKLTAEIIKTLTNLHKEVHQISIKQTALKAKNKELEKPR
jgi:hypothetical protein